MPLRWPTAAGKISGSVGGFGETFPMGLLERSYLGFVTQMVWLIYLTTIFFSHHTTSQCVEMCLLCRLCLKRANQQ